MTASLGGEALGDVQSESWDIKSGIDPMRFPGMKSKETWLTEMDGVARSISITGIYTTTTMGLLNTWLDKIEAFLNKDGGQTASLTFISAIDASRTAWVGVDSFTFKIITAVIGQASYTLRLEEGKFGSEEEGE